MRSKAHSQPVSFWLETAGDDLAVREPLPGDRDVDVAIVGAGFTGLWTAYFLKAVEPTARIAVVEKEHVGFGASGRNGGWCSPGYPVGLGVLKRRFGSDAMRAVYADQIDAMSSIGDVCRAEGIDAHYHRGGALFVARGAHQVPALDATLAAYRRLGFEEHFERLDARGAARRVRVEGALAALYTPHCATLHPGRLVRGLARAVETRGVRIYEATAVDDAAAGRVSTRRGTIRADVVVMATEAYGVTFRRTRRSVLPLYSLIVLTEPLTGAQWSEIGWAERECVSAKGLVLDYLSKTADGRLLFGGRGAPYFFGSSIARRHERHPRTLAMLRDAVTTWFPMVRPEQVTRSWGGPFAVSRDWMPSIHLDRRGKVAWARGFAGQGVVGSFVAGRTLADMIAGLDTPRTRLPAVGHVPRNWEPEPLRYAAVQFVRGSLFRQDARAERTGKPPTGRSLAERLAKR